MESIQKHTLQDHKTDFLGLFDLDTYFKAHKEKNKLPKCM